jgi:hypothetical protein
MVWMVQDKLNTFEYHPKPGAMGGLYLAPKWWSKASISRQWIFALTGS